MGPAMARMLLSCLGLGLAGAAVAGTGGILGPAVAGLAGGIGANLATDLYKALDRRVAERFLDGWSSIDENHHVDRALRLADLVALRQVLVQFNETRKGDHNEVRRVREEHFATSLETFVKREIILAQSAAFGRESELTRQDRAIRIAVLN